MIPIVFVFIIISTLLFASMFPWYFVKTKVIKVSSKSSPISYKSLEEVYSSYNGTHGFDHWFEYANMYEENIGMLRARAIKASRNVSMLEIGVQSGGSIGIWKEYFQNTFSYVGIDINPACKSFHDPKNNIRIEIGSQSDKKFLSRLCRDYGPFDFIVDDGGHTTELIMSSLNVLWMCMKDKGVYAIEDLHTMVYYSSIKDFISSNYCHIL